VAVARHLSFRRAARAIYLDQAAVSRHVQSLEHDLGVQLFRRNRQSVALTTAGQVLLIEATVIFETMAQVRDRVLHAAGEGEAIHKPAVLKGPINLLEEEPPEYLHPIPQARLASWSGHDHVRPQAKDEDRSE
jgi:hypothetical protein